MNRAVVAHLWVSDHSNFGSLCGIAELIDNYHGYRTIDTQRQSVAPSWVGIFLGSTTR